MRQLFVSDLDGTVLDSEATISDTSKRILNQAIDEGLQFTVSTARTPSTALKIMKDLKIHLPIMLMNGVLVYDPVGDTYVKKEIMDETTVMVLLGLIKLKGLNCFLYSLKDDCFFAYYDSADSVSLNYFRNERIMKYDKKFTEVEDLSLVAGEDIIYCILRESKERLAGLHRELSVVKGVKSEFYMDVYNEDYYMLEIYSDRASKKEALAYLRKVGKYDWITGFGDNLNDISLLEACDSFYAVSNAHSELQHLATDVIPSNVEDGVARYIEQIMQNGVME